MKKYFILILMIVWCASANALEFSQPVLKPETVLEKTEIYLVKEKTIALEKYQLAYIHYHYYSQYDKTSGTWNLFYRCKPINGIHVTDCGFTVRVSNTPKPIFEFIPIDV